MDYQNKEFSVRKRAMKYTCEDYRNEMMLVALRKRLEEEDLSEDEKTRLVDEINKLEHEMKLG